MFVSQIFDECAEILGTTDNSKIFRKIQQAVATLMESGHWTHSVADVDVCTGWDRCSITLPRNIDVPLAVNIDGSPTYFRNRLFQYHVNKGGMFNSVEWAWDDRGYVATLMDIIQPSQLVAVAELENDVGKTIRVLGTDQNNRTLRSQLANGTGVDGLLVPIHSQSDFAYGTITPDDATVKTRSVAITPINLFTSATAHGLSSGQGMSVTASTGTIPVALENGQTYYIGVIDAYTVQLFNDPINAQALNYPINLQSIVGAGNLTFKDSRESQVVTALELSSAPAFTLDTANQITFPAGQSLPSPLNSSQTYYANAEDSTHLVVFETSDDAKKNINPVYTTGSTASLNVDIRKKIDPQTTLTFSVPHYYNDGDQVQAFTASGTLPKPLIANQNYFVNVISPLIISLHENKDDAIASTPTNLVNPITLKDSGSGTNSIVKLIPAVATNGTTSQITASGLNIDPPTGSGANAQAVVVGVVTGVRVISQGSGYLSDPNVTFSAPPTPPINSPLYGRQKQAVGYAVRDTINNKILNIVITDAGFGYSSAPSITIEGPGQQALVVNSITKVPTTSSITAGNLTGSGTTATCVLNSHGYGNGQVVTIAGATPSVYNGTFTVTVINSNTFRYTTLSAITSSPATGTITSTAYTGTSATVTTNEVHGYLNGDNVIISGANQSGYNGQFTISGASGNTFTYQVSSLLGSPATGTITSQKISGSLATAVATITTSFVSHITVSDGGSGYTGSPQVKITGGSGSGATAVANVSSGAVTSIDVITTGNGYTDIPTLTINPSTGVFISFTSTGLLPSPLVSGVAYRAEPPLNTSTGNFTVKNADFSDVNITSSGTGTLYVSLSRAFSVTFNNNLEGDFSNLSTGQQIYFGTDYLLPNTSPSIDNGVTPFYLNKINNTTGKIYIAAPLPSAPDAYAVAGGTTGLITITSFGSGQSYYALRKSFRSLPFGNLIIPSEISFLSEDEIVRFSTTNTLPSPLVAGTDYTIKLSGNSIKVYLGGVLQALTTPGTGQLSLDIIRTFNVSPSTSIDADQAHFNTGDAVIPRAKEGDVLPTGLTAGTTYYARRIDNNSFELYDTLASAKNAPSTTGRVSYTTTGETVESTFFIDSVTLPTFVKSVSQVDKPITEGYVSLYAYDYGRSNDMTLIGQYHPSEVNPQYRRIRIGKPCAWARISYRIQTPSITSIYDFIPLEQERAIITAVHACDLEDKDFADQSARYWQIAFAYLKNQQESIDGHAMSVPQINSICYGDTSDPVMF
jgi:hypothetical protein